MLRTIGLGIGVIIIIASVALGLYVGIWVCFVGGIVDVIEQVRADELVALTIAWGIAKVVFASLFGTIYGVGGCFFGWLIVNIAKEF